MPLVILGLIVVLGGALLIYYQLGPKITRRLSGGQGVFSSVFGGQDDGPKAAPHDEDPAEDEAETGDGQTGTEKVDDDDGKVLFIFGDGEREERPLGENEETPMGEDNEHDA